VRVTRTEACCGQSTLHVASGVCVSAANFVIPARFIACCYGDRSEIKYYLKTLLEDLVRFA
jgi:hypothetical protein